MDFHFLSFVETTSGDIGFIASDLLEFPYIHDGCGTANYKTPCKLEKKDFDFFEGYVVYVLPEGNYKVFNKEAISILDTENPYNHSKIFDRATSGLRLHLSLLEKLNNKGK